MYIKVVRLVSNLFVCLYEKKFYAKQSFLWEKKIIMSVFFFFFSKIKDVKIRQCFKMQKILLSTKGFEIKKHRT